MAVDMRETIASAVALALKESLPIECIEQMQTTSGCPVVQLLVAGAYYNLTITKARKP